MADYFNRHTSDERPGTSVIRVESDQGYPVHQSLSCDHPVEPHPPRGAGACDNGPIGLCRKIIEGQRRNGAQHGVEPRPTNRCLRRLPIDAALQLDACDN